MNPIAGVFASGLAPPVLVIAATVPDRFGVAVLLLFVAIVLAIATRPASAPDDPQMALDDFTGDDR